MHGLVFKFFLVLELVCCLVEVYSLQVLSNQVKLCKLLVMRKFFCCLDPSFLDNIQKCIVHYDDNSYSTVSLNRGY